MHVAAIHIAKPQTVPSANGPVATGIFKYPIEDEQIAIGAYGLNGDTIVDTTVHGGLDQAVYFYHAEDYAWWSEQLGREVPYGSFGENITLSGGAQDDWVIGDRLTIGAVELEITAPRVPCFKLAARMEDSRFIKRFADAVRPGFYGRVLQSGSIACKDSATRIPSTEDFATINEVFIEWHRPKKDPAVAERALRSPIACVHRSRIERWLSS